MSTGTSDQTHWYTNPEWWGIIVSGLFALAALIQSSWPKIKALLWKPDVEIYESLLPDVEFAAIGSGIGLCGSLVSRNASALVTMMRVRIRCESDGSERCVDGLFSRARVLANAGDKVELQPRQVIELPIDSPRPYDVIFCNDDDRIYYKELVDELQPLWQNFLVANVPPPHDLSIPENAKRIANANQALFSANPPILNDMVARFQQRFFWTAGTYLIALEIGVSDDKATIKRRIERLGAFG